MGGQYLVEPLEQRIKVARHRKFRAVVGLLSQIPKRSRNERSGVLEVSVVGLFVLAARSCDQLVVTQPHEQHLRDNFIVRLYAEGWGQ